MFLLFQELHSKAEGKFNRLKTQAKNKIATLSKELEKLREEQGASPLNISAQVSCVSTNAHTCIYLLIICMNMYM